MPKKMRHIGALESSDVLSSVTDGLGAYMDYDPVAGEARFGAKGGVGGNVGLKLRTLAAGVALAVLSFTAAGAATFSGPVTFNGTVTLSGTQAAGAVGAVLYSDGTNWVRSATPTLTSLTLTGNLLVSGTASFADGTAAAPSWRLNNAATGLFHAGADALGISIAGVERGRLTSLGVLAWGTTAVTNLIAGDIVVANGKRIACASTIAGSYATVEVTANNVTVMRLPRTITLANAATVVVGSQAGKVLIITNNDHAGEFIVSADVSPLVQEIGDPEGVFSNAAGTAASTNLYWVSGSLTLQNNTGASRDYGVLYTTV